MIWVMVVLMFVMLFLGVPVAVSIGLPSMGILILTTNVPLEIVPQLLTGAVNSFTLMAIPMFMLAGYIMNSAGITNRIFRFATACVGHVRGSLGHVNVMASLIFAGMSGSAVADAAGLGMIEIKAMKEEGFDADFACGVTAASACIGPVFPPSIIFLIFGVMAEVSVGRLFVGGMVPGVLMAASLMIWVYLVSRRKRYPVHRRASLKEFWTAFREAFLSLLTPLIIIGGILSGVFTPTEAAVATVIWALFLGLVVYREIRLKDLPKILWEVAVQSATVIFITASANIIGWILIRSRIPQMVAENLLTFGGGTVVILLLVNVLLLILGCFMEVIASLVILTPILAPAMQQIGVDPVHFGVLMTLNLMIGLLTPPFGMGLYTVQKVAGISFGRVARATAPFIVPLLVVLMLITIFPGIVLFLPNLLMGK